jgi:DNA-binding response OmpR family regulator
MPTTSSVLIVDDDPAHLKTYGWVIESAGYRAVLGTVGFDGVKLPREPVDMVLLDYNLDGRVTAVEVARAVQAQLPNVPVIVLSDAFALPDDIAPFVQGFIRKGDPARLVARLHDLLPPAPDKAKSNSEPVP